MPGDGLVVWLGMRLVFLVLLLGLGAGEVREADKDKDNDDKDDKVNKVDCLGGCTCHLETLTCCHLGHANFRKTDPICRNNCSTTSMVIIDSILGPDSLSSTWLREQGVCPSAVSRLKVTNSSLENLNLLSLPMLKHLEIEGTTGPGWISEPPQSVTDLHLGGASWPCMAPDLNHQETSSKTSLTFGVRMSWLLKEHWASTWKDSNRTLCGVHESDEVKYAWYQEVDDGSQLRNRKPRTILSFLEFTQRTLDSCPPLCTCLIAKGRVQYEQGHHDAKLRSLQVAVVCSNLSITKLPPLLPNNTIFLNLSFNQISSLETLGNQNPVYEEVSEVDLSHNLLDSLEGLETSWLMEHGARHLDLRANKLTELDLQTLEPIMARSKEGAKFFLAGNPWSCNCHNIKTFQDFLLKYNDIIADAEQMQCEEHPGKSLEQLDYKTICSNTSYGLLVFCSLELLLLVAVVVKLTCDCVEYKRTGNLPWCARKLCWSVPGIPRPHWTSPQLPSASSFCNTGANNDSHGSVGQGSSGYLTNSSGGSQGGRPGGRQTAVVRFLPQQQ